MSVSDDFGRVNPYFYYISRGGDYTNKRLGLDFSTTTPKDVLKNLADSGGMLGLSLYAHHLKYGTDCSLDSFCEMTAKTADLIGVKNIGIGSDLCLNQPDSVVEWMRNGTWTNDRDFGEGSASFAGFPDQPEWFRDNRDFINIANGLKSAGFTDQDVDLVMGQNWLNFFESSFGSME